MSSLYICQIGGDAYFNRTLRCRCGGIISERVRIDCLGDGLQSMSRKCSRCKKPKPARKSGWRIARRDQPAYKAAYAEAFASFNAMFDETPKEADKLCA